MAPTRHGVLVLLGLAISIRAAPAGLKERQVGLLPPKQSVSWDSGSPEPTEDPQGPGLPPIFPPQPSDQISLGQPSGWISWETGGSTPTPAPEEPEYPPSEPSNQISLGQPSYSVSWDGNGPGASPTPKPEPETSSSSPNPSGPKSTKNPGHPGYPPWKPWPSKPTKSTAKTTPKPSPTPTPKPNPPNETGQISLGPPRYSVSWDLEKRGDANGLAIKPTSKSKTKLKPTSKKPKPTSSPKPTPAPTPTPTQPGDEITIGPPHVSISWAKKRQFEYDPEATNEPSPEDEEPLPEDPEDEDPTEIPSFPIPTLPNSIGLQPPKVSFGWGKREAAPQTHVDTIGLDFPWHTIYWPKPSSPSYISWGKRQDEPEPTAFPEDPEDPEDPEETGPIEIPAFPVPAPPNSIGLQFPTYSFNWPKPSPPTYVSWGKRQDEAEPTEIPPAQAAPTPTDEVSIAPPQASISWGKRDDFPPLYTKLSKPIPTPTPSSGHVKPTPKPTPSSTPPSPPAPHSATKPHPAPPSHSICPDVTAILTPFCTPPECPLGSVACDRNLLVRAGQIEKTTIVTVIKTLPPATTAEATSTPSVTKCTTAKTVTVWAPCPTYTCVEEKCEEGGKVVG